jgi:hypothetical protein
LSARPVRLLALALAGAALVGAAALCVWALRLSGVNQATLVGVGQPEVATFDCLVGGHFVQPGPAAKLNTEWIIDDDLVPVLTSFRRQGWMSSTHMTSNIQMLPTEPTAVDMGLLRVQVFRALALSYTQAGTTRVVATTRIVICPP